jgi:archaellum component FlaC
MDFRVRTILDDYEGLVEMHEEYAEDDDPQDIDQRALWEQIQMDLKQLSRQIASLQRGAEFDEEQLEEIELQIEDLNDLYGELASLS